MRKVVVSTMMTVNGVIEAPNRWSFDYMKDELLKYVMDQLFASDALIMGRVTFESFAQAWPSRPNTDPFTNRMNSLSKYVASRTLNEPLAWNATLLKGDVAKEVAKLKQQPGQDILQFGSGELTHSLMQQGLIDELRLLVFPVSIDSGTHLMENIQQTGMKLLDTKTFSSGVVALHYQPSQAK
jgi:dihydrofolate reductase